MKLKTCFFVLILVRFSFGQNKESKPIYTLDASVFAGSILLHNPDISHLITGHPKGFVLGVNKKSFGLEEWEQWYNYPDFGATFVYQDMANSTLGDNYALYAHYNFYFLGRNLQLRAAQGIVYNTNPYDKNDNFRNNAYGSRFLSSTLLMLNYYKENIFDGIGFKAGLSISHYSNANTKSPNTSTNTLAFNVGVTYNLLQKEPEFVIREKEKIAAWPMQYNVVFRTGINESDNIGSGQFPFYIFSAYADKIVGRRSAIQFGADVFFSNFLKELIRFQSSSFPENNIDPETDYKRVGVFLGHELLINKFSIETQLGYYVYYPYDFEGKIYNRIVLKRILGKNLFAAISLKSHAAAAEAVEFGLGVRF